MHKVRVLVCPLDWGLGHATRCVPIIRELLNLGAEVFIAGDGEALYLLKNQFPKLTFLNLRGYRIKLHSGVSAGLSLALQIPRILYRIASEHKELQKIVVDNGISIVISDNRYGLWCRKAMSVFITHQLNIIPPFLPHLVSQFLRKRVRHFIKNYDQCWIPDYEGIHNLSGNLSHGYSLPSNVRYIGPLSRFDSEPSPNSTELNEATTKNYDLVAIVSGPEPQRSNLESLLKAQLTQSPLQSLLLRGVVSEDSSPVYIENLTIVNHLNADDLYRVLKKQPIVICRGGYSTLMDLSFTKNKVICIPTPGQTEQEYLAFKGHAENALVYSAQCKFDLTDCLSALKETSGVNVDHSKVLYRQHLKRLIDLFEVK